MIEAIVISKAIVPSIIRRVNVNQFHFSGEFFFERGEREQVIAFDNQIVFDCAFFVAFETVKLVLLDRRSLGGGGAFFNSYSFEIGKNFCVKQAIDVVWR